MFSATVQRPSFREYWREEGYSMRDMCGMAVLFSAVSVIPILLVREICSEKNTQGSSGARDWCYLGGASLVMGCMCLPIARPLSRMFASAYYYYQGNRNLDLSRQYHLTPHISLQNPSYEQIL
ncbi:MAG: hypothetical protein KBC64_00605 [Simkaniaceae bacterium]|nr:hypothetical protein [Simkaniaceae bacterium]